jgi:hypothetical protein
LRRRHVFYGQVADSQPPSSLGFGGFSHLSRQLALEVMLKPDHKKASLRPKVYANKKKLTRFV